MDDATAERIHLRIDETHKLINEVKLSSATQTESMKNLSKDVNNFIAKVDAIILNPQEGCIAKSKAKLSSICAQLKSQWYLITVIFIGILGIAWEVIRKK